MTYELGEQKNLLYRPIRQFTANLDEYFCIKHVAWQHASPPLLEDDPVLLYVRSGMGTIIVNGVSIPLMPGSACLLQTFHVFTVVPQEVEGLTFDALAYDTIVQNYLRFRPESERESADRFAYCPVIKMTGEPRRQLEQLLERFHQEDCSHASHRQLIKTSLLGQITLLIQTEQKRLRAEGGFSLPLGWKIFIYLTRYCGNAISVQDAAATFGCSSREINRELRRISSYGFPELLTRARINRACTQFLMESFSFRYIARYNGFSSENSFYRAFKSCRGMTPQEYRNKILASDGAVRRRYMYETPVAILNYIVTKFQTPITLTTAAAELYLTKDSINITMKKFFNQTFQDVLNEHRLRYTEALLCCTELPICDISELSGFNSPHTLSRLFKERFGTSPGEYRRERRKRDEQAE